MEGEAMPNVQLFDKTIALLQKTLDLRMQNQQVIASNIANADTPGYAPARLEFEAKLQQAIHNTSQQASTTNAAHFPIGGGPVDSVQPTLVRVPDKTNVGDRNGVNVDEEMVALSENQILYETTIQMLNKKFGLLKYIAQDGR
jgi:flagellar basal-body rod protein FlgB